jgi:hypothetical protein
MPDSPDQRNSGAAVRPKHQVTPKEGSQMSRTDPMSLLSSGVPLSLLLDLVDASHLPSRSICRREGGAATWLPHPAVPAARSATTRGVLT